MGGGTEFLLKRRFILSGKGIENMTETEILNYTVSEDCNGLSIDLTTDDFKAIKAADEILFFANVRGCESNTSGGVQTIGLKSNQGWFPVIFCSNLTVPGSSKEARQGSGILFRVNQSETNFIGFYIGNTTSGMSTSLAQLEATHFEVKMNNTSVKIGTGSSFKVYAKKY